MNQGKAHLITVDAKFLYLLLDLVVNATCLCPDGECWESACDTKVELGFNDYRRKDQ